MTTRKHRLAFALAPLALLLGGCSTPGPLHVYSSLAPAPETIADSGGERPIEVPTFLDAGDQLIGLAYDPFTDHLFLRLAPGDRMLVVDRPARATKREFTVEGLGAAGAGHADLAVRPRDGHIFLLDRDGRGVAETTRLGKLLRTFALAGLNAGAAGLAVEPEGSRLFALHADGRTISTHDLDGKRLGGFTLQRDVAASLALDAERRELYAPLAGAGRQIGVFDLNGRLLRTLPGEAAFVDVGPRSFVRVF